MWHSISAWDRLWFKLDCYLLTAQPSEPAVPRMSGRPVSVLPVQTLSVHMTQSFHPNHHHWDDDQPTTDSRAALELQILNQLYTEHRNHHQLLTLILIIISVIKHYVVITSEVHVDLTVWLNRWDFSPDLKDASYSEATMYMYLDNHGARGLLHLLVTIITRVTRRNVFILMGVTTAPASNYNY